MTAQDSNRRTEVVQLAEAKGVVYMLSQTYSPDDITLNPLDRLAAHQDEDDESLPGDAWELNEMSDPRSFDDVPRPVMFTGDAVRTMWVSPSGKPWLGSGTGFVATQAKMKWPKKDHAVAYFKMSSAKAWSVAALPPAAGSKDAPDITALWGTGDDNVYAGTYEGDIYRGDGSGWKQVFQGRNIKKQKINAFGGSGPNDVFAMGNSGALLHFNGKTWSKLRLPGKPVYDESLYGLQVLANHEVVILAGGQDASRLLYGTAAKLTEFGRYPLEMWGMAPLGDKRLLFATAHGVAELHGDDVQLIKPDCLPLGIYPGKNRVFITEIEQAEGPAFIDYDPRQTALPWDRIEF